MFDLDGVIFLGSGVIPGAGAALEAIAGAGVRVVFATNNATRTTDYLTDRIASVTGFEPAPGSIATSATATASALSGRDDPVLVVGEPGLVTTLQGEGRIITAEATAARSVVVGLDRQITYERLERASNAIRGGARFVATNTDATFPTPTGPVPGAGAIVAAVAAAAGVQPEVTGKPHPAMVRHLSGLLAPGDTWMVGDRPETDLALARAAGWKAVLTLTGITRTSEEVPAELRPDFVIDSVADMAAWFN